MKRLNGMDAVLVYGEAPNLHMHTLKVAVLHAERSGTSYAFESFRKSFEERLWASPGIVKASLKLQPVGLQRVSRIGSATSMPPSCAGAGCCRSPGTTPPRPGVPGLWC